MEGHPFTASFPVWVQIVLCTTEAGGVKFYILILRGCDP